MPRLAVDMDEEMYEQTKFIPQGIRAEVFRCLLRLLIQAQIKEINTYVADDLLNNRLVLARLEDIIEEKREVYSGQTTS